MKIARTFIVACCAALIMQASALAQVQSDKQPIVKTTAIEVALIYHKLLDAQPDFSGYVQSNKEIQENKNPALRRVIERQQEKLLEKVYDTIDSRTLIYAQPRVLITAMEINQNYVGLSQRGLKAPIRYELDNGEVYGVIISNARDAMVLDRPYEHSNITSLYNDYTTGFRNLPIEMVLKPTMADPKEHVGDDGKSYKVLAVDLVELRIRSARTKDLVLVKRFLGWSPDEPSVLQQAIQDSGVDVGKPVPSLQERQRPVAPTPPRSGTGF